MRPFPVVEIGPVKLARGVALPPGKFVELSKTLNGCPVRAVNIGVRLHPPARSFIFPEILPLGIGHMLETTTPWRISNSASPLSRLGWYGSRSPKTKLPLLIVRF